MTRVFLIEDEALLRDLVIESIKLTPGVVFTGWAEEAEIANREVERIRPDVVVLDLRLREVSGIELMQQVKARSPESRVLVFSGSAVPSQVAKALQAGATGFVEKAYGIRGLREGIAHAARGEAFFTPNVAEIVATIRQGQLPE